MPVRVAKAASDTIGPLVALIDGEHYPPVVKAALDELKVAGTPAVALGFLGGTEKISSVAKLNEIYGRSVTVLGKGAADTPALFKKYKNWLRATGASTVVDLSDEPVLDISTRMNLIEITREHGSTYLLPDACFYPRPPLAKLRKPSIMVIGTGKRVGKTAISGHITRLLIKMGRSPLIIATGRGGPGDPVLVRAGEVVSSHMLLERSHTGIHAASDYYEDAYFTGAATIGSRRCGGGLFGQPFSSNAAAAVELVSPMKEDVIVVEGSGASVPQVAADLSLLVIGASQNLSDIENMFMRSRICRATAVVITMCETPFASKKKIAVLKQLVHRLSPEAEICEAVFRPAPAAPVRGKRVLFATTANPRANRIIKQHLINEHGCRSVFISNDLSDRQELIRKINENADNVDLLLCEIKAAGIDVVTDMAQNLGKRVVYVDNVPVDPASKKPIKLNTLKVLNSFKRK